MMIEIQFRDKYYFNFQIQMFDLLCSKCVALNWRNECPNQRFIIVIWYNMVVKGLGVRRGADSKHNFEAGWRAHRTMQVIGITCMCGLHCASIIVIRWHFFFFIPFSKRRLFAEVQVHSVFQDLPCCSALAFLSSCFHLGNSFSSAGNTQETETGKPQYRNSARRKLHQSPKQQYWCDMKGKGL